MATHPHGAVDQTRELHRRLAIMGGRARLVELFNEARRIYDEFPELRPVNDKEEPARTPKVTARVNKPLKRKMSQAQRAALARLNHARWVAAQKKKPYKVSDAVRQRMSDAAKRRANTPEGKRHLRAAAASKRKDRSTSPINPNKRWTPERTAKFKATMAAKRAQEHAHASDRSTPLPPATPPLDPFEQLGQ